MAIGYGSKGNDVLEYQKKLKEAGLYTGALDGSWGPLTDAADKAYKSSMNQAANALKTTTNPAQVPTGLIGLRATGDQMGANIGWSPETGATVNGGKVDTSGLQNFNNYWYGTPEQIYGILGTSKTPEFQNPVFNQDEISGLVQKILNPAAFTWDKDSDPVYQSLLESATINGKKAFNNNIADLTSLTGGRLNSWAAGQASQARANQIAQADAQIPALYELAYGMYQDQQKQNYNALDALLGIDDTYYGRHRDSIGDYKDSIDLGLGLEEQKYNRGIDERNYNRDVLESDRGFNRDVFESNRNYGLNLSEFNYRKEKDTQSKLEQQPPTAGQLANYNQIREGLLKNYSNPADALAYVERLGKSTYTELIGENLYNQLLSDLQGGYQQPDSETFGAIYSEMMNSSDPVAWLRSEAPYMTDAEIKQAVQWLPKDTNIDALLAELLR